MNLRQRLVLCAGVFGLLAAVSAFGCSGPTSLHRDALTAATVDDLPPEAGISTDASTFFVDAGAVTSFAPTAVAATSSTHHMLGGNIPIPACTTAGYALICNGAGTNPSWQSVLTPQLPDAGTGGLWYQNDSGIVTALPACSTGYLLTWSGGLPSCIAATDAGAVTWANDLSGSTAIDQYVVNISGGSTPGTVTVTSPTLSFSQASTIKTTTGALTVGSAAGLNLGTSAATGVTIGNTAATSLVTVNLTSAGGVLVNANGTTLLQTEQLNTDLVRLGTASANNSIVPSGLTFSTGVSTPTLQQLQAANSSAPQSFTLSAQTPGSSCTSSASCTPGSIAFKVGIPGATGSPTEGYFQFYRGTSVEASLGAYPGVPSYVGFWGPGITPSTSNWAIQASSANTGFNAASQLYWDVGGTPNLLLVSGAFSPYTDQGAEAGTNALRWSNVYSFNYSAGNAPPSDVATTNTLFTTQAPYASAVTNLSAGSFLVNSPAPLSGGGYGGLGVQAGGTTAVLIGSYGIVPTGGGAADGSIWFGSNAASPSLTNFGFLGSSSFTYLNGPSGGSVYITTAGTSANGIQVTATTVSPGTDLQVELGVGIARFSQLNAQQGIFAGTSTSGTGHTLELQAENAKASSGDSGGAITLFPGKKDGAGFDGAIELFNPTASTYWGAFTQGILYLTSYTGTISPGSTNWATQSDGTNLLENAISGYVGFNSGGNQYGAIGVSSSKGALWLGASGLSPGSTNYVAASDGTSTTHNAPGAAGYHYFDLAGNAYAAIGVNSSNGTLWLGTSGLSPTSSNYALYSNGTSLVQNAPGASGSHSFLFNGGSGSNSVYNDYGVSTSVISASSPNTQINAVNTALANLNTASVSATTFATVPLATSGQAVLIFVRLVGRLTSSPFTSYSVGAASSASNASGTLAIAGSSSLWSFGGSGPSVTFVASGTSILCKITPAVSTSTDWQAIVEYQYE